MQIPHIAVDVGYAASALCHDIDIDVAIKNLIAASQVQANAPVCATLNGHIDTTIQLLLNGNIPPVMLCCRGGLPATVSRREERLSTAILIRLTYYGGVAHWIVVWSA